DAPNQVEPCGDVSPLVRATGLQCATVASVELDVVVGLQEYVTELGVAHSFAGQAGLDRVTSKHLVDAEMLAHVTHQLQGTEFGEPVGVVGKDRVRGLWCLSLGGETQERRELCTEFADPFLHRLDRVELTLRAGFGIPDEPCAPADQGDGPMPGLLETGKGQ